MRPLLAGLIVPLLLFALGGCPTDESGAPDGGGDGGSEDGGMDGGMDGGVDGGTADCLEARGGITPGSGRLDDALGSATVQVSGEPCARRFTLGSSAQRRDGLPASPRTVDELPGWPSVSTGHTLFDALYALALEEVRENSVSTVSDGAYDDGAPLDCGAEGCFETGRLWSFVWTRDTAYAVDLGLASLDPIRSRNSLEFKLSELRTGGSPQIVQDTGTGGSYPVSTDRAVWALGAARLLSFLDFTERQAFQDRTWAAVQGTLEHDLQVVFDPGSGLYLGEQSFLDWREQSYPTWVTDDPVQIHHSQALSTNLGHLQLLLLGAWLAGERGDLASQTRYQGWASDLKARIHEVFFHDDLGLWGTFTPGTLDRAAVRHFDLLGTALAVLLDVGTAAEGAEAVRRYPLLPHGPPVIWPQQKETPIYHNRAIWPFVTAYWAKAAAKVRNDAAVVHALQSLMRGAALNLSNMENLEGVSGAPWVDDGPYSGPVVNSQRQLWSVAGYLSVVQDVIFGLQTSPEGLRVAPYLPRELRASLFSATDTLVLEHFPFRGADLTIELHLPPVTANRGGAYAVGEIRLDGIPLPSWGSVDGGPGRRLHLEVDLIDAPEPADTINLVTDTAEYRNLFAPLTPSILGITEVAGGLELQLASGGEPANELSLNVYRDGVRVAANLPGDTTTWTDTAASAASPSHCYTVEAVFVLSGNHSQHARPVCWWGPGYDRITTVGAQAFTAVGGTLVNNHGRWHHEAWGDPGHTLSVGGLTASRNGEHLLQVSYGNGAGPVSTGITCAVKRIEIFDEADGSLAGSGLLVMPHLGDWSRWSDSSFVPATLLAGHSYRVEIRHDATSLNMSDLEHNARYTAGSGGAAGAYHHVNISDLKILGR